MTHIRFLFAFVAIMLLASTAVQYAAADDDLARFRVGIAIGTDENVRERMEPFRVVLEEIVDRPVDLYLIDTMGGVVEALAAGEIDYARLSPAAYGAADAVCGCVEPLVSARPDEDTERFHAIVVAPRKEELTTLDDLKGQSLGVEDTRSIAGYRVPLANLKHEGVDPWSHFRALIQVADGVEGIQAVLDGRLGATLAWSTMTGDRDKGYSAGSLTEIHKANRNSISKLAVVWQSQGIPFSAHVVPGKLPDELKRNLRAGLMELQETSGAAYAEIEPGLPGGFMPVVHSDFRAVMRTFEPELQVVFGR
ncbi:putative phosphate uptake ABC transporter periplasmic solute-binding protein [Roseibium sp. TrichSKD4]|uniref:phosphate/phosphite/phosphonate ABC transporter substrate-binding protein n=1 Tax=Roseibium sp. TrichSKD4 TaxID=744980 RepID=UPI0001E56350|nr:PhnD/SsuA/transferrin family substrate-binding protein [Roseibium sp. TrichSKD4]EFO33143.1 putative phosphate uptake ABC transporter periplasmic solute-binding protein [Roseibium sp. TrichSKD4]